MFNGSDLGKDHSANGLVERLANRIMQVEEREQKFNSILIKDKTLEVPMNDEQETSAALQRAMEIVLGPTKQPDYIPGEFYKKKRKKKKSRGLHL